MPSSEQKLNTPSTLPTKEARPDEPGTTDGRRSGRPAPADTGARRATETRPGGEYHRPSRINRTGRRGGARHPGSFRLFLFLSAGRYSTQKRRTREATFDRPATIIKHVC